MTTEEKPRTVRVACRIVNGILIRLFKPGYDDGTGDGVKTVIHDGPSVRLNGPSSLHTGVGNTDGVGLEPGFTDVDAKWMASWLEQNKQNPFVGEQLIYVVEDEKAR